MANMNYVDSLDIFGIPVKENPCIKGSGAPTESTVADVGFFYMDTLTGDVWKCTAVDGGKYVWESINADAVLFTPQTLTEEQKVQARENIGAIDTNYVDDAIRSLEGSGNATDILAGATWRLGYTDGLGGYCHIEGEYIYYGYCAYTTNFIPVDSQSTYYYNLKVPADKTDRVGQDVTTLEVAFTEYDANKTHIKRRIFRLYNIGAYTSMPASSFEGGYEVVRGDYTPSENTAFIQVGVHTFREDGDGSKVLVIYNSPNYETDIRLLPIVSTDDNDKILKVSNGKWIVVEKEPTPTGYIYVGEQMPSKVNRFNSEEVFRISSGAAAQDIEIYGKYCFVSCSTPEQIRVFLLEDNSWVVDIDIAVNHGSGMQFSSEFYDSADEFPLLYVGGDGTGIINVIRVSVTDDVWSATIVRQLHIPDSYGYWHAPSIDAKNNILYTYGYKKQGYWPMEGNTMKLARWDLNVLTENDDGTFTPTIVDECETPYLGVTQGRKFYGGNLYVAFADTAAPHNARIVTIDAVTGIVKADIDVTSVTTSEAEGLCYRIVGDDIYWYLTDYYSVYRLIF